MPAPFLGLRPLTTAKVRCAAVFYRDADRGDAVGYYQGLADLLEKRGVLANDKQIADWNGSELRKDAQRPRVELTLEVLE
jgi:Holliday junction resolvase RusA-like endonuclease